MPYTDDLEFEAFIHQLPKTETHLHMEGACPFELLQAMDPKKYANPPAFWDDSDCEPGGLLQPKPGPEPAAKVECPVPVLVPVGGEASVGAGAVVVAEGEIVD